MKILFCALKYEYGNPKLGLSFEHRHFFDVLKRMEGIEAEYFPMDEIMQEQGRNAMNEQLIKTVEEKKPDLLFCFLFTEEIKKETIKFITQKTSTKTFNWFADDHWRFPIFSRYWAPLFTVVSTTDSKALKGYQKLGINVIKTQWGFNPYLYNPVQVDDNKYDITFVGKNYGKREVYIKALKAAGLPAEGYGKGWQSGIISDQNMLEIFSGSKINLNFSETGYYGIAEKLKLLASLAVKKELGKYKPNFQHPVSNIRSIIGTQRRTIKGRTFEIPACGGFLLTGYSDEDIREYYDPGKEIVVFQDKDDLIQKCHYYLEHENERKKIAQAGFERTVRDHSYSKRFGEIFKALEL